jgi:hypothetical protein
LVKVEPLDDRTGLLGDCRYERPDTNSTRENSRDKAINPVVAGSFNRRKLR